MPEIDSILISDFELRLDSYDQELFSWSEEWKDNEKMVRLLLLGKDEAASSRKASKVLLDYNNSLNRSVRSGPNLAYSFYRKSTSFVSASAISSTLLGSST